MRVAYFSLLSLALLGSGCGAKTGLRVMDAGPPLEELRVCAPLRVFAPTRVPLTLRAPVEPALGPTVTGYQWSLDRGPTGSTAAITQDGTVSATLTPDRAGTYSLRVQAPVLVDGAALSCPVEVIAREADPRCPDESAIEPRVVSLPTTPYRLALDRSYAMPRVGNSRSSVVVATESAEKGVAVVLLTAVNAGDLVRTAEAVEARVASSVGAVGVLVGQSSTTVGGQLTRRSVYRVTASTDVGADVPRDRVLRELGGVDVGATTEAMPRARVFTLVTLVTAAAGQPAAVIVAVAPSALVDDPTRPTGPALRDVSNGTALVNSNATLAYRCELLTTDRESNADVLWLVDTSSSMDDDQERLGNTAARFFDEMRLANVSLRVAVVQAGGAGPLDLDDPGWEWISGDEPDGPLRLARTVTARRFRDDAMDRLAPYPLLGGSEEPVAAGVLTVEALLARGGGAPFAKTFRPMTTRAALFVTDERGTNDDGRFFARDTARWGDTPSLRIRRASEYFRMQNVLTFGFANVFEPTDCDRVDNFSACVATLNGNGFIPLSTARDDEVAAGLSRIVDAIAGAVSPLRTMGAPITSSLSVATTRPVPRSRASGFDVDDAGRSLLFFGSEFRLARGQSVRVAYFEWASR